MVSGTSESTPTWCPKAARAVFAMVVRGTSPTSASPARCEVMRYVPEPAETWPSSSTRISLIPPGGLMMMAATSASTVPVVCGPGTVIT